jgi:hypothetical protein
MAYKLKAPPAWLDMELYVQWTKGMTCIAEKLDQQRQAYIVIARSDSRPIIRVLRFFPIIGGKCQVSMDLEFRDDHEANPGDLIRELLDTLVK